MYSQQNPHSGIQTNSPHYLRDNKLNKTWHLTLRGSEHQNMNGNRSNYDWCIKERMHHKENQIRDLWAECNQWQGILITNEKCWEFDAWCHRNAILRCRWTHKALICWSIEYSGWLIENCILAEMQSFHLTDVLVTMTVIAVSCQMEDPPFLASVLAKSDLKAWSRVWT